MPIERGTASAQINRLSQLPFFSTLQNEAYSAMVTVVAERADDPEHAKRAIGSWLYDSRGESARLPTEGDLMQVLENTREKAPAPLPDLQPDGVYCGKCNRGKVYRTVKVQGREYSAMGTCVCQGGTAKPDGHQERLL
jgi:hypothetical protein